MVRKSKWISATSPTAAVSQVAREALRARLRTFAYYVPLAAHKSDRDVEYVHQLRVSTRRAMAAVKIFRPLLPKRRTKWLIRQLREMRQVAGEARDFDVFGRQVAQWVEQHSSPAAKALLERIERLRDDAQKPIRKMRVRLERKDFARRIEQIIKRTRWRGGRSRREPTFAAVASQSLRPVVRQFLRSGTADHHDIEALHRFRIAAKHLRYSMEVFAGAFDADFRATLYPLVEEVQTRLGDINDHAAAAARLRGWMAEWKDPQLKPPLEELLRLETAAIERSRRKFVRWWSPKRAADLRRRFSQAFADAPAARGERSA